MIFLLTDALFFYDGIVSLFAFFYSCSIELHFNNDGLLMCNFHHTDGWN
jgi:hypothetical protein